MITTRAHDFICCSTNINLKQCTKKNINLKRELEYN